MILTIMSVTPIDIISNISDDDITTLQDNVEFPEEPTILTYLVFPFIAGFSFIGKMFFLLTVSTTYQFLTLILTPLTIGFIICLYSLLRNG